MLIDHEIFRCLNTSNRCEQGFTMIEALIALVVLTIGLLGLASMYSKSMMVTHGAYLRSLASIQSMDMAERIRANIYLDHASNSYTLTAVNSKINTELPQGGCDDQSPCTSIQLRDWDIQSWLAQTQSVFGALFESAAILFDSTADEYEIVLQWRERDPDSGIGSTGQDVIDFTYRISR